MCTICMLQFTSRAQVLGHVHDKARVCNTNFLLRGPFLSDEAAQHLNLEVSVQRRLNKAAGVGKDAVASSCTRTIGPYLPDMRLDGTLNDDLK